MATCSICNARKGKRKCLKGGLACSQCCGETRGPETCNGCSFFGDGIPLKNYRSIPYYETTALTNSPVLENIANVIESTLCAFDVRSEGRFTDKEALRLIELLLNEHHFKEPLPAIEPPAFASSCTEMRQILASELSAVDEGDLIKVLATVYRSIQRRTNGGNAYLNFIQRYVGPRIGSGKRLSM